MRTLALLFMLLVPGLARADSGAVAVDAICKSESRSTTNSKLGALRDEVKNSKPIERFESIERISPSFAKIDESLIIPDVWTIEDPSGNSAIAFDLRFKVPVKTPYFLGGSPRYALGEINPDDLAQVEFSSKLDPGSRYAYNSPEISNLEISDLKRRAMILSDPETIRDNVREDLGKDGDLYAYATGGFNKVDVITREKRPEDWVSLSERRRDKWTQEFGTFVVKISKYLFPEHFNLRRAKLEIKTVLGRKKLLSKLAARATFDGKPFIEVVDVLEGHVVGGGGVVSPFIPGPSAYEIFEKYYEWSRASDNFKAAIKENYFDKIGLDPKEAGPLLGAVLQFYRDVHDPMLKWEASQELQQFRNNRVFYEKIRDETTNYHRTIGADMNHGRNIIFDIRRKIFVIMTSREFLYHLQC